MDDYHFFDDKRFQKDLYAPEQFAGRREILEELVSWAAAPASRPRLKLIKAPPGYGKTWLMHAARERLKTLPDQFVIFYNALNLTHPDAIRQWLADVWRQAHSHCPRLDAPAPDESIAAFLSRLMVCLETSPALRPIFLLDGIDEPIPNQQKMLEKQFLEPALEYSQASVIISCRDDFGFSGVKLRTARRSAMRLPPLPPPEAREQLQKRPELNDEDPPIDQDKLAALVSPYPLNVPYLNTILIRLVKHNLDENQEPLLSANDLRRCWLAATGRKFTEQIVPSKLEENLKAMSAVDGWSQEEFAQQCQLTMNRAGDRIDVLMALGVVTYTDDQQYQVVNGLRELIQAELRRRGG